jgi:hypothetical protein
MNARTRKAVGCFVLIAYLALYAAGAAALGANLLGHAPNWAVLLYFLVAGVIWVAPLRPLLAWMSRAP